jgi:hypothetical protein
MMGINWTLLALLVIGLFALFGFLKGWWREAMTTIFLAILTFFLLMPDVAQIFIDLINAGLDLIWRISPNFILDFLSTVFGLGAGAGSGDVPPQVDANSPQTWLIMLLIFIGLATLIGRMALPGSVRQAGAHSSYVVTCGGRIFGLLLGALNGWLIVSLVRAYLDGSRLPGGQGDVAAAFSSQPSPANNVTIQAVDVPTASILDSFLPWLFMGIGAAVFIAALMGRYGIHEEKGFRRMDYKPPLGYQKTSISSKG